VHRKWKFIFDVQVNIIPELSKVS